jgi:hypothetical protein
MRIKNWKEFQHFKDRTPPWIKLYRYLLDDPDWHSLSGDEAKTLIMLWLVASEDKQMEGNLPALKNIAFRFRITEKELNQRLIKLSNWLILDDNEMISSCYQDDTPEERREEERKRKEDTKFSGKVFPVPEGIDIKLWSDFLKLRIAKKLPMTDTALNGIIKEAQKAGVSLSYAITICCERGWGTFKAAWVQNEIPQSQSLRLSL